MKNEVTNYIHAVNNVLIILIGIGFAALFWILEAVINTSILHKGNLSGQIVPSDPNEIGMRSLHVFFIIMLSVSAQVFINRRRRVQEKLEQTMEELSRTLEGTVLALAATVETRDPYTAGHQQRVAHLACAIAREMGLPEEQIKGIYMAGVIHDIGKISVPADILSKPGRITEAEFSIIKTHPRAGYDILKDIKFPWPIAQMVLQHQERMNGSGYPAGLSGEDIILEARVLAVADVVEAMSSHRPYRPALGIENALEEISKNKGILYDSNAVDACVKLFTKKGFVLK